MAEKGSTSRLKFSNFKLKTLLDITNAIVANLPVDQLIAQFQILLKEQLNINKVLIFFYQNDWKIILKSGVTEEDYANISPARDLESIRDITVTYSMSGENLSAFDFIIPILKDDKSIAYVLMDDIDGDEGGVSPSIKNLQFIQTITNIIIVSIQNHRLMEENMQQERIKKEMEMAAQMQNMLVPKSDVFNGEKNIRVESFYMPHFEVGGDYYDFGYIGDDEMFFCIADVSGKGMSAAILMSNFQASLKALFVPDMELTTLVMRLNSIIVHNSNGERFITLFIGRYNLKTHVLRYVNAGHNAPILYNCVTKSKQYLNKGCVGIGMLDEIEALEEGCITFENNHKILCFTDGLVELEKDGIPDFGQTVVEEYVATDYDIETTINKILQALDIKRSNTTLFDDITILGIDFFV